MPKDSKKARGRLYQHENEINGFIDFLYARAITFAPIAIRKLYKKTGRVGRLVRKKVQI